MCARKVRALRRKNKFGRRALNTKDNAEDAEFTEVRGGSSTVVVLYYCWTRRAHLYTALGEASE